VVAFTLQLVAAVLVLLVPREDHRVVDCSCYSYILHGCCFASVTDTVGEGHYPAVAGYSSIC
jgi:hypothetical protein